MLFAVHKFHQKCYFFYAHRLSVAAPVDASSSLSFMLLLFILDLFLVDVMNVLCCVPMDGAKAHSTTDEE